MDYYFDKIYAILLSRFNFKIISLPFKIIIQSPNDILVNYLCMKFGLSKLIITLILAFLL